jgi:hypothetical protein
MYSLFEIRLDELLLMGHTYPYPPSIPHPQRPLIPLFFLSCSLLFLLSSSSLWFLPLFCSVLPLRFAMEDISVSDYSISVADFSSVHRPESVDNLLSALVGDACDGDVRPLSANVLLLTLLFLLFCGVQC